MRVRIGRTYLCLVCRGWVGMISASSGVRIARRGQQDYGVNHDAYLVVAYSDCQPVIYLSTVLVHSIYWLVLSGCCKCWKHHVTCLALTNPYRTHRLRANRLSAGWSSWLSRHIYTVKVVGSSPTLVSCFSSFYVYFF